MESLRNKNLKPSHPGEFVKEIVLPELGMTQSRLAEELGVSKRTVNEILNKRRSITPEIAIKLSRVAGSTPGFWLRMQQATDLWELEHSSTKKYASIKKLHLSEARKAS